MTTETAEFPLVWVDPADAGLTWRLDLAHSPDPMTPLGFDLYYDPFIAGFGTIRACQQNYFIYLLQLPEVRDFNASMIDPERVIVSAARWRQEIIPEVVGYCEYYRLTDFDAMAGPQLVAEVDRLVEVRVRLGELHTKATRPHGLGMTYLIETCRELTGGDELSAVRVVQGYGHKSVEAGVALWRLARLAASIPAVRELVLSVDTASAKDCLARLEGCADAQAFLEEFRAFLDEFGWRSNLFELADPTWAEHPAIPLNQLRAYLQIPDYDPVAEQKKLVEQREEALRQALAPLEPGAKERLLGAVGAARQVVSLLEDHNYYIDQRAGMLPRRLVLAAGRRLVSEGLLANPADVFYLRGPELRAALLAETGELHSRTEARKLEMARWSRMTPPAHVGPPPDASAGTGMPDRFIGAVGLRSERRNELRGNAASSGIARGPARVLRSLDEADKLKPGDVLVARTTMPPWTPLFAVAAAVVTETGGILIHAAVVAREYGLPAVLGVQDATRLIRDGQLLEVDGSNGIVRLLT
jgi:pyruvate,water dikinase